MPRQQFATRPWRALHDACLSSERLATVSNDAFALWIMLVIRQDDAGRFPWTPVRVRSLTAIRDWNLPRASQLLDELRKSGSVSVDGIWVTLHRGAELNGPPTSGSKESMIPRFYPGYTDSIPEVELNQNDSIPLPYQVETSRNKASRNKPAARVLSVSLLDWSTYLSDHWQPFITDDWQTDIVKTYPMLNLLTEAKRCVDWWAAKPDPRPKRPASSFRNWLVKATEILASAPPAVLRPQVNGSGSRSSQSSGVEGLHGTPPGIPTAAEVHAAMVKKGIYKA